MKNIDILNLTNTLSPLNIKNLEISDLLSLITTKKHLSAKADDINQTIQDLIQSSKSESKSEQEQKDIITLYLLKPSDLTIQDKLSNEGLKIIVDNNDLKLNTIMLLHEYLIE